MREFGITRLGRITGLDNVGFPVWSAIRPNARTLAQSQGKGIDDSSAQASALMEAIEVATAERTDFDVVRATPQALSRSGTSFECLNNLLRRGQMPYRNDQVVAWLEGHDLIEGRPILAPFEALTLTDARTPSRYWQSTDGLASGNTLWEAVVHGLCERIERDAMTLWLLRSDADVMARCLEPDSFRDPVMDELCRGIADAGLQLRLFDASCDTGVPVFAAFITPVPDGPEDQWKHFDLSGGYGCHPAPLRAALRAVTEAVQTRLTTISAARDDFDPNKYQRPLDPSLFVYPRSRPAFRPMMDDGARPRPENYLPFMIEALRAVGVRSVIVVPLERGERGFAVARVVVGDLESPSGDRRERFGRRAKAFMGSRQ